MTSNDPRVLTNRTITEPSVSVPKWGVNWRQLAPTTPIEPDADELARGFQEWSARHFDELRPALERAYRNGAAFSARHTKLFAPMEMTYTRGEAQDTAIAVSAPMVANQEPAATQPRRKRLSPGQRRALKAAWAARRKSAKARKGR